MAGQNGYLTSVFDGTIPNNRFGEAVGECDLVGYDTNGNLVKASAADTGTVAAVAICPRAVAGAGGYEAVRFNGWRVAFPATLPSELTGVKPGDKIYLSAANAGGMTKTAPSNVNELVQQVGIAYWSGDMRRKVDDCDANGMIVDIDLSGGALVS